MTDLDRARKELKSGNYTCIVCKSDVLPFATGWGVKPLLSRLDAGICRKDFSAPPTR